jgi:hypothetical protein
MTAETWTEQVVSTLKDVHKNSDISYGITPRQPKWYKIWKDGEVIAYIARRNGALYRPTPWTGMTGAHKYGERAGVIYYLSDDKERNDCIDYIYKTNKLYGPLKHRTSDGSHKYEEAA